MQRANDNQDLIVDDPAWFFIADFSLGEAASEEEIFAELTAGSLFHTIRELGLSSEDTRRIAGSITASIRGASDLSDHCSSNLSVRICLFCNRSGMDSVYQPGDQIKGGWGYYVIERGRDLLNIPRKESCRELELYLYKEGE